ncbi:MAG TPA: putative Ig domain-containing protein [Candidatus Nanoarchaeia archaeon]|nr:putative Ig domain-containing protein [Candidatus Nanoarchaeia archaeon]
MKILRKIAKKGLEVLLAGSLIFGSGCSLFAKGEDNPNDEFINHAPEITSTAPTASINEGDEFIYDVDATDADTEDTLTYSLTQNPIGMIINPITGLISWIPSDSDSDKTHQVTVKVEDDGYSPESVEQDFTIQVINTEHIGGRIFSFTGDYHLDNIQVTFDGGVNGVYTAISSTGMWAIQKIPIGEYNVTVKDLNGIYETYKPGKAEIFKSMQGTFREYVECKLLQREHRSFLEETLRANGEVRRFEQKPGIRIYTKVIETGEDIDVMSLDSLVYKIGDFDSIFFRQEFNEPGDIEYIPEILPASQPEEGYIYFGFTTSSTTGTIQSYFNGNTIVSSSAELPYPVYSAVDNSCTYAQKVVQSFAGGGETSDSTYSDSIFYNPPSNLSLNEVDEYEVSSAMYSPSFKRPLGNQSLGTPDNYDVNPDETIFNEDREYFPD